VTAATPKHVVVGTAGHIDHGKTSLVKALTGIDTDRLPEEKARGITIDLGFAFLEEPDGLTVEIVDVPGHERFVKNMLAGVGAARQDEGLWWLHEVGRGLVLQGVLSCLVIGVGTLIVPHVTRGDAPVELRSAPATRLLYLLAGLVFAASFFVEALVSVRIGFAVRAAVVALAFVPGAKLWRPPTVPGIHRRLLWLGSWALPLGYLLATIFPEYRKACLHVVFIGCFAVMVFSIALHVALTHAGQVEQLGRRRLGPILLGVLLACALLGRLLVDLDPSRLRLWLGCAAASFVCATILWLILSARALRTQPG